MQNTKQSNIHQRDHSNVLKCPLRIGRLINMTFKGDGSIESKGILNHAIHNKPN